jgi:hypothetical protein
LSDSIRDIVDASKSSNYREGNLWIKSTGVLDGVFVNNGTYLVCNNLRELYSCLNQQHAQINKNVICDSPRRLWLFTKYKKWDLDKLNLTVVDNQFMNMYFRYVVDHYLFLDNMVIDSSTILNTTQDMKLFPNGEVIKGVYFAPVGGSIDEIIHRNRIIMAAYNLVTHSMIRLRAQHGIKIKGQFFVYGVLRFNGVAIKDFGNLIHIAMPLYGSYYTG